MAETRRQLVEMGFSAGKIEAALRNTSGTLEDAIAWLEELQNRPQSDVHKRFAADPGSAFSFEREEKKSEGEPTAAAQSSSTATPATGSSGEDTPAETSGASTPSGESAAGVELTREEREQRLNVLREKAAQRRAEKEKELAKDQRLNDQIRKKRDQDSVAAMEEVKRKEAVKEAQRRRQEARDDVAAKQRIKDLIEADRRARKAAASGGISSAPTQPAASTPAPAASAAPRVAPTDTKIRVRDEKAPPAGAKSLPFPVETTLGDVAQKTVQELQLSYAANQVVFVSNFPRKEYDSSVFDKTIKELNLQSSSLVVKQK